MFFHFSSRFPDSGTKSLCQEGLQFAVTVGHWLELSELRFGTIRAPEKNSESFFLDTHFWFLADTSPKSQNSESFFWNSESFVFEL